LQKSAKQGVGNAESQTLEKPCVKNSVSPKGGKNQRAVKNLSKGGGGLEGRKRGDGADRKGTENRNHLGGIISKREKTELSESLPMETAQQAVPAGEFTSGKNGHHEKQRSGKNAYTQGKNLLTKKEGEMLVLGKRGRCCRRKLGSKKKTAHGEERGHPIGNFVKGIRAKKRGRTFHGIQRGCPRRVRKTI